MTPQRQSDQEGTEPHPQENSGERLRLEPYIGPKSHHASRAFAEMVAAREELARKNERRLKLALFLAGLVITSALAFAALSLFVLK